MSTYISLQKRYTEAGIPTYTEIILGLPGETKKSFISGLFGATPEAKTIGENKKYADLAKILLTERGVELMDTIAELKPSVEQARKILGLSQTAGIVGTTTGATQKFKGALSVKGNK